MMQGGMADDWLCTCGAVNAGVATRCYRCGRDRTTGFGTPAGAPGGPAPEAPGEGARLIGISLRQGGRVLPLDSSRPLTLGRAATADLVLDGEGTVSSQHARIIPMPPFYA